MYNLAKYFSMPIFIIGEDGRVAHVGTDKEKIYIDQYLTLDVALGENNLVPGVYLPGMDKPDPVGAYVAGANLGYIVDRANEFAGNQSQRTRISLRQQGSGHVNYFLLQPLEGENPEDWWIVGVPFSSRQFEQILQRGTEYIFSSNVRLYAFGNQAQNYVEKSMKKQIVEPITCF